MLLKRGPVFFHWAVGKSCQECSVKLFISTFICDQFAFEKRKIVLGFFLQNAGLISQSATMASWSDMPEMVDIALTSDGLLVQSTLPSRVGSRCIWETWWSRNRSSISGRSPSPVAQWRATCQPFIATAGTRSVGNGCRLPVTDTLRLWLYPWLYQYSVVQMIKIFTAM